MKKMYNVSMESCVLIVDCSLSSKYLLQKDFAGSSTFDLVLKIVQNIEFASKIEILISNETDLDFSEYKNLSFNIVDNSNLKNYLLEIKKIADKFENILYFRGDAPFYILEKCKQIYKEHMDYVADFSYAEGFPLGVVCEVIRTSILEGLAYIAGDSETHNKKSFFPYFEKEINSFDIYVFLSDKDRRRLRLEFFTERKRDFYLCKKIYSQFNGDILNFIDNSEQELMTLPSYYQFQISDKFFTDCIYLLKIKQDFTDFKFSFDEFKKVLDKIEAFSEDAVISISYLTEPSGNLFIYDIIEEFKNRKNFTLLIETSGVGWEIDKIRDLNLTNIIWIVTLDSVNGESYKKIRGAGFNEAFEFAKFMLERYPDKVYLQSMRMVETVDEVDEFYQFFKDKTKNIIIQKFNNFAGILEDKNVVDLSPIEKYPCWHLKRDITILLDGTVVICFQDILCKHKVGNIYRDSLEKIFLQLENFYKDQVKGNNLDICLRCDEYYTFNF